MNKRIAVVDNTKLKDMQLKKHIQGLCPVNRAGKECIYFDGSDLLIDETLCIGCGICVNKAPEAIKIVNLPKALKKSPVHRYGKNEFALYNLPSPVFGKVVGILGMNGIGKSTAIKILARVLKPNLGQIGAEARLEQLLDYFKGTQTQLYFEKLKKGKIRLAYKPQHVDAIAKQYEGKIEALLRKVDDNNKLKAYAEKFELTKILDRDIKHISGGELQRVAVCATFLKDAEVYIFDEITSYLDIKQRLRIAKGIRELSREGTAVLVIEHDLIALDYMADLVHIMYGTQGVFGVVSQLMPTKKGVNTFLDGYLQSENVRFRDQNITFPVKAPQKSLHTQGLIKWPSFEKRLGNFALQADAGELKMNEKVGVLGENGIGKTSFMKLMAGRMQSENTELDLDLRVAYKPQYIDADSGELVMSALREAVTNYDTAIIRPLGLKPLMLKKINELSGGELQKVSIAICLSQKDAELMLLDEPSAYLDVEHRLKVSKVIADIVEQRQITALIVDHDLLFLDYLSDRLMVFSGRPAEYGRSQGPFAMEKGMNILLKELGITLRRDESSGRPRINKEGSVKDREQKRMGKYYYA